MKNSIDIDFAEMVKKIGITPMTRSARFTNLPSGEYGFEVMARNDFNLWSTTNGKRILHNIQHYSETFLFQITNQHLYSRVPWVFYVQ